MVIKIPSKNIFAVDNQKYIDNQADKVELQKSVAQLINDTQNVYNETFNVETYTSGELQVDYKYEYRNIPTVSQYAYACAYVNIQPYYVTKQITIPKRPANSIITQILSGIDNSGQTNIKYSTICTEKIDSISAKLDVYNQDGTNRKLKDITITQGQTSLPKRTTLPKTLSQNETYDNSAGDHFNVTAEITLNDLTNIGSPDLDISEDNENYYFTGTFYCGATIYELKGSGYKDGSALALSFPMQGTITIYTPKQIDISVYGNTITLDLQSNTIKIGDGNSIYNVDGNELMQDTNSPTIESTYQKVIDEWKNGKECATIKCSMGNYMGYNVAQRTISFYAIQIITRPTYKTVYIRTEEELESGSKLILSDNKGTLTVANKTVNGYECYTALSTQISTNITIQAEVEGETQQNETTAIALDTPANRPMTFMLGDIVEPYVYGANGQDKPMSLYSDGTPKKFQVVGRKISYDGAVWQTLTIQEVSQDEY